MGKCTRHDGVRLAPISQLRETVNLLAVLPDFNGQLLDGKGHSLCICHQQQGNMPDEYSNKMNSQNRQANRQSQC
jgi:hypothetical protein